MNHTAYGRTAIIATTKARNGMSPPDAWAQAAAEVFPDSTASQEKNCPKNTFPGLCEAGRITGIPCGAYTKSTLNKGYALAALELLAADPTLEARKDDLWKLACGDPTKTPNRQMDVVLALRAFGDV